MVLHPKTGTLHACQCTAPTASRILGSVGVPERFKGFTFESFRSRCDDQAWAEKQYASLCCEAYANLGELNIEGAIKNGIVLSGPFGVGKTGLASALLSARMAAGVAVRWIDHLEFCKKVQATYGGKGNSEALIADAAEAELLMFDDAGDVEQFGPITDDKRNITYDVLTRRHRALLPTVITSNLGIERFSSHFGNRIFDRVWEMCHWIELGGKNFRRE